MRKGFSFALFDVGETILGALVFSTFFPLYITKFVDTKVYSFLYGLSFLFSFLLALYMGKLADRKALRKHFFVSFAIGVSLLCSLIGVVYGFPFIALAVFLLMAIFHQQALVFYNSMLLGFDKRGGVSGLGVSLGYVGSAVALLLLADTLKEPEVYFVVALLYLFFFLPSAMFIPNPVEKSETVSVKEVFKDKRFMFLILTILSITEVANTLIAMMGIYLRDVYDFDNTHIYKVIGTSALGGVLGGLFWGKAVDTFGVKRVFPFGFFLWAGFLLLLPFVPQKAVILAGFLAGFSLSHVWTCSRVYVIEEFPSQETSLRLSFLSLTERIASMTGLLVWSLLLLLTDDNYRLSASLMAIFPIVGFILYRRFVVKGL